MLKRFFKKESLQNSSEIYHGHENTFERPFIETFFDGQLLVVGATRQGDKSTNGDLFSVLKTSDFLHGIITDATPHGHDEILARIVNDKYLRGIFSGESTEKIIGDILTEIACYRTEVNQSRSELAYQEGEFGTNSMAFRLNRISQGIFAVNLSVWGDCRAYQFTRGSGAALKYEGEIRGGFSADGIREGVSIERFKTKEVNIPDLTPERGIFICTDGLSGLMDKYSAIDILSLLQGTLQESTSGEGSVAIINKMVYDLMHNQSPLDKYDDMTYLLLLAKQAY